eukprot:1574190-Rhodomonas_salina.1
MVAAHTQTTPECNTMRSCTVLELSPAWTTSCSTTIVVLLVLLVVVLLLVKLFGPGTFPPVPKYPGTRYPVPGGTRQAGNRVLPTIA